MSNSELKGLRVYFRTQAPDGSLHFMDFPNATGFDRSSDGPHYDLIDKDNDFVVRVVSSAVTSIQSVLYKVEEPSVAKN